MNAAAGPDGPTVVRRYLDAMVAHAWDDLAATLAPDVVRRGPYHDDVAGRDEYVRFLAETFAWMQDYEMELARVWGDATCVTAELAETVSLDGQRLRTEEAIVFDLAEGVIGAVSVYLRQSTATPLP